MIRKSGKDEEMMVSPDVAPDSVPGSEQDSLTLDDLFEGLENQGMTLLLGSQPFTEIAGFQTQVLVFVHLFAFTVLFVVCCLF